tara:strand:- start:201 stop:443 length:243 start_codon:yes stop_codon:yes gene_type:complete
MKEIQLKIKQIMAVIFDTTKENIPDDAEPLKIDNWDSLNHLQLIVALEQEFDIKFSDDELTELLSLALITNIIQSKIIEK